MHTRMVPIRLLLIGGLCLGTFLIYQEALSNYFLSDDLDFLYYVAQWTREGQLVPKLLAEFFSPQDRGAFFYRPLSIFSYAVDYLIWGTNPIGWHLTNLFLHIANVMFLWVLVEKIAGRWGSQISLMVNGGAAAWLFALRPSFPETVAWISGRPDELALLGMLISFLSYLRANGKWGYWYLLSLAGFLFALGGKEVGVTLPGGLVALHLAGAISLKVKGEEPRWQAWVRQIVNGVGPFGLILICYFGLRFHIFGTPFKVYQIVPPINLNDSAWLVAKLYALKIFLTQSLNMGFQARCFLFATIAMMLLGCFAACRSSAARRVWVFGTVWLIAELLPLAKQLSIAPTGEGMRLLYIPSAALAVLTTVPIILLSLLKETQSRKTLGWNLSGAVVLFIVGLIFLSFPLQKQWLKPWLLAGQSMKRLPASIAARAEKVSENGFAILLIPDHIDGALFGRNGQGTLMEPPVQAKLLGDQILVVTPSTLLQHAPRLVLSSQKGLELEYWFWNVRSQRFEQLFIRHHTIDDWLEEWRSSLRNSGFPELANELGGF